MVGFFNYYRDFIPNYAGGASPLTSLLCGHKYQRSSKGMWKLIDANGQTMKASDINIDWGMAQDKALNNLKGTLSSPPTLAYPDFSHPFLLYVDASQRAFAAALHQQLPPSNLYSVMDKSAAALPADAIGLNLSPMPTSRQQSDSLLKAVINAIETGHTRVGYKIQDGTLVYIGPNQTIHRLCVPISDLPAVFHKVHDLCGHFGFAKTALRLNSIHHPHLPSSLQAYIVNCPTCLRTKLGCCVGELSIECALLADRPFHMVSADLLLGLPECKGLDAALIIVDIFSKLVLTAPCTSCITSAQLFDLLADLVLWKGWKPKVVITNSDKCFVGTTGQQFAKSLGVQLEPSAPYHQQANPVEQHIQTLQCVLHAFATESAKDWVDTLPAAELTINSTPSLTTRQAPFDLIYIVQPDSSVLPSVLDTRAVDCLTIAKARLKTAWQTVLQHAEKNKSQYDTRYKPLHILNIGNCIFICIQDCPIPGTQRHAKLDPGKVSPFPVKQVLSRHHFRLNLPPNLYSDNLFDISQLEPAQKKRDPFNRSLDAPDTMDSQGVTCFEVEAIVGQQPFRNYIQYRVKWCRDPRTTWEFEEDLLNDGCGAMIQDWNNKQGSPPAAFSHMLDSSLYERPIAFISTTTSPADAKLLGLELEISCLVS
ncbi:hypothetical protein NDA13_004029 [Ustilago tritici]|nr:hypothetical protein NDA13_004029 [Ustilago tritici]